MAKENVYIYFTNGNVEKMFVRCPEVGMCNASNQVGVFDHQGYCYGDDCDEWYEDIAIYWITEIAAIYVDNKCCWHNEMYIHEPAVHNLSSTDIHYLTDIPDEYSEEECVELPF